MAWREILSENLSPLTLKEEDSLKESPSIENLPQILKSKLNLVSTMEDIDQLDRSILSLLMKDANLPFTEIAKTLDVSGGTIHVRMKKLKDMGVVLGASLTVDYSKLGYDIVAFLGIYLDKSSMYVQVIQELKSIPEIVGAHYTTGNYSIFAKIVVRDTKHLRDVLYEKIQKIVGIQRTETFISLEESINRSIDVNEG